MKTKIYQMSCICVSMEMHNYIIKENLFIYGNLIENGLLGWNRGWSLPVVLG